LLSPSSPVRDSDEDTAAMPPLREGPSRVAANAQGLALDGAGLPPNFTRRAFASSNDSLDGGLDQNDAELQQMPVNPEAQKRHTEAEITRFAESMIARSTNYLRESIFRVLKFSDDQQMIKMKDAILQALLAGSHDQDSLSVKIFHERVFPHIMGEYKNTFRGRRRSVNQAMERIAVGEFNGTFLEDGLLASVPHISLSLCSCPEKWRTRSLGFHSPGLS
jgi:hypothetical protein